MSLLALTTNWYAKLKKNYLEDYRFGSHEGLLKHARLLSLYRVPPAIRIYRKVPNYYQIPLTVNPFISCALHKQTLRSFMECTP